MAAGPRLGAALIARRACGPGVVVVAGATGKLGRSVVEELLRGNATEVRALCRDLTRAEEVFSEAKLAQPDRLRLLQCDVVNAGSLKTACDGADAALWCVSGGAGGSALDKVAGLVGAALGWPTVDEAGLEALGQIFAGPCDGLPQIVMCSSAAITRPRWSERKKERLAGCADIPIVRLNPFGILDKKRQAEDRLRGSGARYTIVRPVGLNDAWPPGRVILSQGDVAVGRISRADLAALLVDLLAEPEAVGKTFEALSIAGYPASASLGRLVAGLRRDTDPPAEEAAVEATYDLLQQLLPGERQDSAALAMGQTYEQLDAGREGRLGPRGEEQVPERVA